MTKADDIHLPPKFRDEIISTIEHAKKALDELEKEKKKNVYLESTVKEYGELTAQILGEEYLEVNEYFPDDLLRVANVVEGLRKSHDNLVKFLNVLESFEPELQGKSKEFVLGYLTMLLDKEKE